MAIDKLQTSNLNLKTFDQEFIGFKLQVGRSLRLAQHGVRDDAMHKLSNIFFPTFIDFFFFADKICNMGYESYKACLTN